MAKKISRFETAISGALAALRSAEKVYEVDAKGRKVRVWSEARPCTKEDIYEVLAGQRTISEEEALEGFGPHVLRAQIGADRLYPMGNGVYAVTLNAQKVLGLPKKRTEGLEQVPMYFFGTLKKKWVRA